MVVFYLALLIIFLILIAPIFIGVLFYFDLDRNRLIASIKIFGINLIKISKNIPSIFDKKTPNLEKQETKKEKKTIKYDVILNILKKLSYKNVTICFRYGACDDALNTAVIIGGMQTVIGEILKLLPIEKANVCVIACYDSQHTTIEAKFKIHFNFLNILTAIIATEKIYERK